MKKCCLVICLLGIILGLSGCGGNKFEKSVPDEMAATDFWNDFYNEDGDLEYVKDYYFAAAEMKDLEEEFTVLARGMAGEEVDLEGVDLDNISDYEEIEVGLRDSNYNWILVKTALNDGYYCCQTYAIMLYDDNGGNEFYYVGQEDLTRTAYALQPRPAEHYAGLVCDNLKENFDINCSDISAAEEQTQAKFNSEDQCITYDYEVTYRKAIGIIHVDLVWDNNEFRVDGYEFSEELEAQLPPEGAYFEEECVKDKIYVLRDGYFYPIYNLPTEEFLYDENGKVEEKVAAVHVVGKYLRGTIQGLTERVPIYPDDKFVIFKGDPYSKHMFLTKVEIPASKKYINLDYVFSPSRMLKSVMDFRVDNKYYEVGEVNGVEVKGTDWAKQTLFKDSYYVGGKNDKLNIGAYKQTDYFEFEIIPDYRLLEANESTISIDYERTKNGYGVFDCSGMKGLYIESDYDCLLYFQ